MDPFPLPDSQISSSFGIAAGEGKQGACTSLLPTSKLSLLLGYFKARFPRATAVVHSAWDSNCLLTIHLEHQTRFEARKRGLELGSPNKSIPRSGSMATRRPETWTSRRQQNGGQATPAAEAAPSDPLSTANGNGVPPGDPMSYYNSTRRPEGYSPYTEEEQTIVTQARTTHEQTTEHARRALQVTESQFCCKVCIGKLHLCLGHSKLLNR